MEDLDKFTKSDDENEEPNNNLNHNSTLNQHPIPGPLRQN